jgi:hypothetical protein
MMFLTSCIGRSKSSVPTTETTRTTSSSATLTLSKKWKLYQFHSVKFSAYLYNFIYIFKELFPHYFMIKDTSRLKYTIIFRRE